MAHIRPVTQLLSQSATLSGSSVNQVTGTGVLSCQNGTINGLGSVGTTSGIDPATDWAARIVNALYAENFSDFTSTNHLRTHEVQSNPTRMELTTEHALSGKTCRLWTFDTDADVSHGFQKALDGTPTSEQAPATVYKRFYFQVVFWADDFYNWPFQSGSNNAPKLFVIDREPFYTGATHSSTSNPGEVVVDNQFCFGFVHAYRRLTSGGNAFQGFEISRSTPANSSNFQWQTGVNNTSVTLSDQDSYERRYGPFRYGMDPDFGSTGSRLTEQFDEFPDPDAAEGGVAFNRGGYTVVEVFVDYDEDECKIWAAHYGEPPKLIIDSNTDNEGSANFNNRSDIDGWSGFQLTTFRTAGLAEPNVRPDMYVDYAEVIVSETPILFPGGYPLSGTSESELLDLLGEMSSNSWAILDASGASSWSDTRSPTTDHMFEFGTHFRWDPVGKFGYFSGCSHTSSGAQYALIGYSEEQNTWTRLTRPSQVPAESTNDIRHGYTTLAIDPIGRKAYNQPTYAISSMPLWVGDITDTGDITGWVQKASIPDFAYTGAIDWFPDFANGEGRLINVSTASGTTGFVYAYELDTNTWTKITSFNPSGENHQFCEYVPGGQCIIFGAGNGSSAVWKLDADGNVTSITPPGFALGTGNENQKCIFAGDPDNPYLYVLNVSRQLWRLNTDTDTWTQMATPTGLSGGGNQGVWDCTGGMVRNDGYKAIIVAEWRGNSAGRTWVYKP